MKFVTKNSWKNGWNVLDNAMPASKNGWKPYCLVCRIMRITSDKWNMY